MIGDLPDLNEIFEPEESDLFSKKTKIGDIEIQISRDDDKWLTADFIDVAIGGIGIHVMTPYQFEISSAELNKIKIRFVKKTDTEKKVVLKQFPVMVRWQETDNMTGNVKIGLHFGAEYENDPQVKELLKKIKDSRLKL